MGEILIEIFAEYIFAGIWIGINAIYDWIKGLIFGIPKNEVERNRLEKKWLYKKIILKREIDHNIPIGTFGSIMEIKNRKTAITEFYDNQGNIVEINNQMNFDVDFKKIKLARKSNR